MSRQLNSRVLKCNQLKTSPSMLPFTTSLHIVTQRYITAVGDCMSTFCSETIVLVILLILLWEDTIPRAKIFFLLLWIIVTLSMQFYQLPKDLIMTLHLWLLGILYIKDYKLINNNVSYFIVTCIVYSLYRI